MIVEMRTYLLQPGSVPEVENRFRDHLHHRTPLSPLGGLWHSLNGQLDTVVHLWPYQTIQQRSTIRAQMMQPPKWPPPLREFLVQMESTVLLPASFSPPLAPARHGALYEFCIDSYLPGGPAAQEAAWSQAIARRNELSPLVFCGTTEFGTLNQWVHLWAYRDAAHRDEVQLQLAAAGSWPPAGWRDRLRHRRSFLAAPAECSPLN